MASNQQLSMNTENQPAKKTDYPPSSIPGNSSVQKAPLFISYSRSDRLTIDRLFGDLRKRQFVLWMDVAEDGIRAGKPWQDELKGQMSKAEGVIACMSPDFFASPFCRAEIEQAFREHKPIYPVIVRRLNIGATPAEFGLDKLQTIDLTLGYDEGLHKLVLALPRPGNFRQRVTRQITIGAEGADKMPQDLNRTQYALTDSSQDISQSTYSEHGFSRRKFLTTMTTLTVASAGMLLTGCNPTQPPPPAPNLRIDHIEAVQSVQTVDNQIRLIARKHTELRIFVDSGIPNNQNPVIASIVITQPSVSYRSPVYGTLIYPVQAAQIDRNNVAHSVICGFVPQRAGIIHIDVTVFVPGHQNDTSGGYVTRTSLDLTFVDRPLLRVQPILVRDDVNGLPEPTMQQFFAASELAWQMWPFAADGFITLPPVILTEGGLLGGVFLNLNNSYGWFNIILQMTIFNLINPFQDAQLSVTNDNLINMALVPSSPQYAYPGYGWPSVAAAVPAALVQAPAIPPTIDDLDTFAHEMGHTLGLYHAPCGNPPSPVDNRLPGNMDQPGVNTGSVAPGSIVPAGSPEIMSYCPSPRWTSTAGYNIIFDKRPVF